MVLSLQHDVAAGVIQLIDGAHGTGLNALSTTLNFTLDARDKAIKDILALVPPAPPAQARSGPSAHASGGAVVGNTFDTLMPNTIVDFDDEMQAIDGLTTDATDLTTGGRRLLSAAMVQILRTERVVNAHWPPIPAEA
jgi:hypothetical protein